MFDNIRLRCPPNQLRLFVIYLKTISDDRVKNDNYEQYSSAVRKTTKMMKGKEMDYKRRKSRSGRIVCDEWEGGEVGSGC